jgi:hypothetical protein
LSPLSPGETRGGDATPLTVPIRLNEHFNQTDFALFAGKPWEILLDYEDIFGERFQSIHRKSLFDPDPSTMTWSESGSSKEPKATLRPLPWFTFDEKGAKARAASGASRTSGVNA